MGVVPLNFIGSSDKPCFQEVGLIFIGVNYFLEMFVWGFFCDGERKTVSLCSKARGLMPSLVNQTRGSRAMCLPRMLQVHMPNIAQCKEKALLE